MKRIETEVLFHPSMLMELTAQPRGGSNMDAYVAAVDQFRKAKADREEKELKADAAKKDFELWEKTKDQEGKPKGMRKTFAEKFAEAAAAYKAACEKWDIAQKKEGESRDKMELAEQKKDVPVLSVTAKKAAKSVALEIRYNRRKRIDTKATRKGKINEEESVKMYNDLSGEAFEKNKERKRNEYFTGEIDIKVNQEGGVISEVPDIKTRYDLDTFFDNLDEDIKKGEELQLQAYCDLWDAGKAKIINVLTDTPAEIINEEIEQRTYKRRRKSDEWVDLPLEEVIYIARHHIYEEGEFWKFLTGENGGVQHLSDDEMDLLICGDHPNEEAQREFNLFIEVEFEDRFIINETKRNDELIEWVKRQLDNVRLYIAEKFNIHHIEMVHE